MLAEQSQTKEVFISYHMDSSTDIVEKISAALDGAGISNWHAKKDIEGSYAGAIIDAIDQCKVFLLIVNQYSSASAHCLNEINAVFDRLSRRENVVILPFKIDKCELSKDAYYYLGRIRMFDGSLPPEMARVAELVDRISMILGRQNTLEKCVQDYVTKTERLYKIIGSSVSKHRNFIGRKKELAEMYSLLQQHPHKLFLAGMGGIGKSEIAKAYCDIYRDAYDVVLWVSYDGTLLKTISNDFSFSIQGIERSDFPEDNDQQYFMQKLKILKEIADERVLIVLDNFDVLEDEDLEQFCNGNYSVLFTTRYREVSGEIPEYIIEEIMDEQEQMELFTTEYKKTLDAQGKETVKKLLSSLGGHPLSIALVASTMMSNRIAPDTMLEIIEKTTTGSEKRKEKAAEKIKTRLQEVFSVAALTDIEKRVLINLVLMPIRGVDVETFYGWCNFDDFDVIDGLIQKNWVVHHCAEDKVHLHPIVKDVMTEELKKDLSACDRLLESLLQGIKDRRRIGKEGRRRLVECFASVRENLPEAHPLSWKIKWGNAKMIMESSRYDESCEIMRQIYWETEDLTSRMRLRNEISHGLCLTGRPLEGIAEAEKGLALIDGLELEALTAEQRDIRKNLYTRLNEANRILGNLDQSEKYMRMIIADDEKFPEESAPYAKGWYYYHLARVLAKKNRQEDFIESDELLQKAKQLFLENENMSAMGYIHQAYGMLRMYEGRYEEALEETSKAAKVIEETMGSRHTDVAKMKLLEANIYRAKGDEENALKYYGQAEEMMYQRNNSMLARKVREVMESGRIGYTN